MTDWNRVRRQKLVEKLHAKNTSGDEPNKYLIKDKDRFRGDPVIGAIAGNRATRQKAGKAPITLPTIRGLEGG